MARDNTLLLRACSAKSYPWILEIECWILDILFGWGLIRLTRMGSRRTERAVLSTAGRRNPATTGPYPEFTSLQGDKCTHRKFNVALSVIPSVARNLGCVIATAEILRFALDDKHGPEKKVDRRLPALP